MRAFACTVLLLAAWVPGLGQPKRAYLRYNGKDGKGYMAYIDYNRYSKYYDLVSNFKFNRAELSAYNSGIKLIKGKDTRPLVKQDLAGLSLKWCPLRAYQSQAYIYYPANPANNYRIAFTDTTTIEFGHGNVTAFQLLSIKKINERTFNIVRMGADRKTSTTVVHIVDARNGVALFEGLFPGVKYSLMVKADNVHNYPIIVNPGKGKNAPEYPFATPDLRNLIEKI